MKKNPTSTSPGDEPGHTCSNTHPDFPEYLVAQSELNDLVRYLNLLKSEVELLACHLHGWNLLQQGVKVSCRKCQQSLSPFISVVGELVYCNNVEGLLQELECTHNPEE
jgi:hypothetical protein